MPNENTLFTCGADGCFKSWILKENRIQASNETDETTFNWIYNSCDGYRDMIPTNIDFITLKGDINLVAVSFNHIATIWQYDQYGVVFLSGLIHCDAADAIKEMRFVDNNLVVSHLNFVNLWKIQVPVESADSGVEMLTTDRIKFSCVWSHEITEVLTMIENPMNSTELLLFIKKSQRQINEETSTEIQSIVNLFCFFWQS